MDWTSLQNVSVGSGNITEPFCNFVRNCTNVQVFVNQFGSPVNATISFSGLILNLVIILVIRDSMKRRQTQAQVQLTALAYSDLTVGASYVGFFIIDHTCTFCLPCSQAKVCFHGVSIVFIFWSLASIANRSMLLYISFDRARAIRNATNAICNENRTQCKGFQELGVCTAVLTIFTIFVLGIFYFLVPYLLKIPQFGPVATFWVIYLVTMVATELVLANFVLFKLRSRKSLYKSGTKASVEDDFEKLVALVALVFCGTCVIPIIWNVANLSAHDQLETAKSPLLYYTHICNSVNSSGNLIIYLLASRNFRRTFIRFCKNKAVYTPSQSRTGGQERETEM